LWGRSSEPGVGRAICSSDCFHGSEVHVVRDVGFTLPAGPGGIEVGISSAAARVLDESFDRIDRQLGRLARPSQVRLPFRVDEGWLPVLAPPLDLPAFLVQQPVMVTAQEQQVAELRLAPVSPVLDVMRVGEAQAAAREAAAPVPDLVRRFADKGDRARGGDVGRSEAACRPDRGLRGKRTPKSVKSPCDSSRTESPRREAISDGSKGGRRRDRNTERPAPALARTGRV